MIGVPYVMYDASYYHELNPTADFFTTDDEALSLLNLYLDGEIRNTQATKSLNYVRKNLIYRNEMIKMSEIIDILILNQRVVDGSERLKSIIEWIKDGKSITKRDIMDKLNWFGIIIKIILPLSIPAISSVALYVFMIAWNEFLFSLMFLDNPNSFTLSRAIQYLSGDAETPRQYLMAGSVVVTIPVLLIFVYFEKYLVSGLTAGSVKG